MVVVPLRELEIGRITALVAGRAPVTDRIDLALHLSTAEIKVLHRLAALADVIIAQVVARLLPVICPEIVPVLVEHPIDLNRAGRPYSPPPSSGGRGPPTGGPEPPKDWGYGYGPRRDWGPPEDDPYYNKRYYESGPPPVAGDRTYEYPTPRWDSRDRDFGRGLSCPPVFHALFI
ncbi:hypothetical protein NLJ89_g12347 [Agrocybe chaxingu]|uniref:Uncharacterized protein n=1 Tax=Agrocybe chaxingu TaxID=84603 RepID=A0A9W8JMG9_9AGAR|nr:hypothetical protein NLJ89_g12347 [Agrocybe chaxingu]